MPSAPTHTEVDANNFPVASAYNFPVASAAGSAVVVKAQPGRLCNVVVTATGSGTLTIYDNASAASGTVLFALAASAALGNYTVSLPADNGITVASPSSSPAVTIGYS